RRAALFQDLLLAEQSFSRLRSQSVHKYGRRALLGRSLFCRHRPGDVDLSRRSFAKADLGRTWPINRRDCLRIALVSDRASADVALPARRSHERSPDVSTVRWPGNFRRWGNFRRGLQGKQSASHGKTTSSPTERSVRDHPSDPLRKRIRHFSAKQSLANGRNALARRDQQKPKEFARLDELRQHVNGERRLQRRDRLFPSHARERAAVSGFVRKHGHRGRRDESERAGRTTFQGSDASRSVLTGQLYLLRALSARAWTLTTSRHVYPQRALSKSDRRDRAQSVESIEPATNPRKLSRAQLPEV